MKKENRDSSTRMSGLYKLVIAKTESENRAVDRIDSFIGGK